MDRGIEINANGQGHQPDRRGQGDQNASLPTRSWGTAAGWSDLEGWR